MVKIQPCPLCRSNLYILSNFQKPLKSIDACKDIAIPFDDCQGTAIIK